MRNILLSSLAAAVLLTLPGVGQAKERGCAYRLAGISEARADIDRALRSGRGLATAEAKLTRARVKAAEEGCFFGSDRRRSFERGFIVGNSLDRRDSFDARRRDERRRFERDLDRRDRRLEERLRFERRRDRRRFETLRFISSKRRLTWSERRELRRIRARWNF